MGVAISPISVWERGVGVAVVVVAIADLGVWEGWESSWFSFWEFERERWQTEDRESKHLSCFKIGFGDFILGLGQHDVINILVISATFTRCCAVQLINEVYVSKGLGVRNPPPSLLHKIRFGSVRTGSEITWTENRTGKIFTEFQEPNWTDST